MPVPIVFPLRQVLAKLQGQLKLHDQVLELRGLHLLTVAKHGVSQHATRDGIVKTDKGPHSGRGDGDFVAAHMGMPLLGLQLNKCVLAGIGLPQCMDGKRRH